MRSTATYLTAIVLGGASVLACADEAHFQQIRKRAAASSAVASAAGSVGVNTGPASAANTGESSRLLPLSS
jgi:hypothetical protein